MAVIVGTMGGNRREPSTSPFPPTWLLARRALRERRAMRQAQTSQSVLSRRAVLVASSHSCSSMRRFQLAELRRESLVRRRAFAAAAYTSAAIAQLAGHQRTQPPPQPPVTTLQSSPGSPSCSAALTPIVPSTTSKENVNPETYFLSLLEKRGRSVTKLSSVEAGYVKQPTAKQVLDYQSQPFLSDLVRRGDMDGLRKAAEAGRGMDASNKFGESVVHIACRRGNMDVLKFLLANGGSLTCCDDLGRFPLHEVCWAVQPRFDIVRLFLDGGATTPGDAVNTADTGTAAAPATNTEKTTAPSPAACDNEATSAAHGDARNDPMESSSGGENENASGRGAAESGAAEALNPLLVTDKRGCTPLRYVKEESWSAWRRFLDEVVDEYWPSLV